VCVTVLRVSLFVSIRATLLNTLSAALLCELPFIFSLSFAVVVVWGFFFSVLRAHLFACLVALYHSSFSDSGGLQICLLVRIYIYTFIALRVSTNTSTLYS
jgi:hypothetical protein